MILNVTNPSWLGSWGQISGEGMIQLPWSKQSLEFCPTVAAWLCWTFNPNCSLFEAIEHLAACSRSGSRETCQKRHRDS